MIRHLWMAAATASLLWGAIDPQEKATQKEVDQLQGYWEVVASERDGVQGADAETKKLRLIFTGNRLTFRQGDNDSYDTTFKLDPAAKPAAIDITHVTGKRQGQKFSGIYALEGDGLKICWSETGGQRPAAFSTKPKVNQAMLILKRTKP